MQLNKDDLRNVVLHLPKDVREILKRRPGKVFVGGGFIRAVVSGEKISDIDMFGDNKETLAQIANKLALERQNTKLHSTKNAITLLTENRLPVQFITRWLFTDCNSLIESFDFSVCAAAIYYKDQEWHSQVSDNFYSDLAAKRLRYTYPQREEEAGGSMLRVMKYVKRGYSISPESLGGVMARVTVAVNEDDNVVMTNEKQVAIKTQSLLREVDPLLIIDGLDVEDDHDMPELPELPAILKDDIPF